MKYLILLIFSFLSIAPLAGQGTLQFNQVITQTNYTGYQASFSAGPFVVPAGKVWKIVSAVGGGCNNQFVVSLNNGLNSGWLGGPSNQLTPFWLKAGDELSITCQAGNGTNNFYFLSIIEFNVIP